MNLSVLRELLGGKPIAHLEKELGFSNGSISKWEKSPPSVDKVERVAKYFGVSVDYLLTGGADLRTPGYNSKDINKIVKAATAIATLKFHEVVKSESARLTKEDDIIPVWARIEAVEKTVPKLIEEILVDVLSQIIVKG